MKTVNVTTATKEQVIQKHIKEFDRIINYMNALKAYCTQLLKEDEEDSCGYRGDGANDPDNFMSMLNKFKRQKESDKIFDVIVNTAEQVQHTYNHFIVMQPMADDIKGLFENCEEAKFPAEYFPDNKSVPYTVETDEDDCDCYNCDDSMDIDFQTMINSIMKCYSEDEQEAIMEGIRQMLFGDN